MQLPAVQPYQIQERSSACIAFFHVVPNGMGLAEVLAFSYWRNAWKLFENRALSTIDLIAENGAWEAKVRILSATDKDISFRVLWQWAPATEDSKLEAPKGMRVEHIPTQGWRVIAEDGTVHASGKPTREEAIRATMQLAPPSRQTVKLPQK